MTTKTIHQCQCETCQNECNHEVRQHHHQVNVMMSRLDEQQRRWYAAVEAKRYGHGGITLVRKMTGLDDKTIRRGIEEMDSDLIDRPTDRVRIEGGGRPSVEKKLRQQN